jgi:hypothetical protein
MGNFFDDAWTNNYHYSTLRHALVLALVWVITIYVYIDAHHMRCLPDWEFCH